MIVRVFTAEVPHNLHAEFESKFKEISVPLVQGQQGLIRLEIARPTQWNPDTFSMISYWTSEEDIRLFAGEQWNQAHIPAGMEKYIQSCSVQHFEQIGL
ncbi:antibiotic biosynthesis monooxygenase family protein [Flagellimonas flava]|uniref:antibiotic biosynthesis monooxygenase family protein n=1 Tax=Flagellimonas flava TaxID=570519 RepID=UPI003D660A85